MPDLMVIDGGKGQLGAALDAARALGLRRGADRQPRQAGGGGLPAGPVREPPAVAAQPVAPAAAARARRGAPVRRWPTAASAAPRGRSPRSCWRFRASGRAGAALLLERFGSLAGVKSGHRRRRSPPCPDSPPRSLSVSRNTSPSDSVRHYHRHTVPRIFISLCQTRVSLFSTRPPGSAGTWCSGAWWPPGAGRMAAGPSRPARLSGCHHRRQPGAPLRRLGGQGRRSIARRPPGASFRVGARAWSEPRPLAPPYPSSLTRASATRASARSNWSPWRARRLACEFRRPQCSCSCSCS